MRPISSGSGLFAIVTVTVWVIGGLGVWLFGPSNTVTIGSSSLVYGWLAYLVARGVFTRNAWQLLIGALLVVPRGLLDRIAADPAWYWREALDDLDAVGDVRQ